MLNQGFPKFMPRTLVRGIDFAYFIPQFIPYTERLLCINVTINKF